MRGGTGMCASCPSPTPCGLGLGTTDPGTINVAQETLDLRRAGLSAAFPQPVPAVALGRAPHGLAFLLRFLRWYDSRPPTRLTRASLAAVLAFSRGHFSRT